jgi:hypothetical protein
VEIDRKAFLCGLSSLRTAASPPVNSVDELVIVLSEFAGDTVDSAVQQLVRWLIEPEHRTVTVASTSHA